MGSRLLTLLDLGSETSPCLRIESNAHHKQYKADRMQKHRGRRAIGKLGSFPGDSSHIAAAASFAGTAAASSPSGVGCCAAV